MSAVTDTCPVGETHCPLIDEVSELRRQVITDPLTGLHNVRHFRSSLQQELERTRRTGMSTVLMMVDLDHFKRINDTHGHEAGNQVLIATARLLMSQTRMLDVCCRYGGEEFAVILPSTELMLARQVAERFRQALAAMTIDVNDTSLQVTASIGLAASDGTAPSEHLIEQADSCLYQAKQDGRNRVAMVIPEEAESAVSADEKDAIKGLFGGD